MYLNILTQHFLLPKFLSPSFYAVCTVQCTLSHQYYLYTPSWISPSFISMLTGNSCRICHKIFPSCRLLALTLPSLKFQAKWSAQLVEKCLVAATLNTCTNDIIVLYICGLRRTPVITATGSLLKITTGKNTCLSVLGGPGEAKSRTYGLRFV